jgi:uncharacterized protein
LSDSAPPDLATAQQRRGFRLRTLHQWHWISSALCLIGMLVFAATGLTLDHAARIEARPQVLERSAQWPTELLQWLGAAMPRAMRRYRGRCRPGWSANWG